MSKRHVSNRRRSYGRRQHELHERVDRRSERRAERAWRLGHEDGLDPIGYSPAAEQAFGYSD
jgi:hypothetical protein